MGKHILRKIKSHYSLNSSAVGRTFEVAYKIFKLIFSRFHTQVKNFPAFGKPLKQLALVVLHLL